MTKEKKIVSCEHDTPVGRLEIGICDGALRYCNWIDFPAKWGKESFAKAPAGNYPTAAEISRETVRRDVDDQELIREACNQIDEYFAGNRTAFRLPLGGTGTELQRRVWSEIRKIPFGKTATYKEIAERIGRPDATRAVANAVGANPLPIFVACHRVVRSDGGLGGYTGPGVEVKKRILDLEKNHN